MSKSGRGLGNLENILQPFPTIPSVCSNELKTNMKKGISGGRLASDIATPKLGRLMQIRLGSNHKVRGATLPTEHAWVEIARTSGLIWRELQIIQGIFSATLNEG